MTLVQLIRYTVASPTAGSGNKKQAIFGNDLKLELE
jgi:hypothetical protein